MSKFRKIIFWLILFVLGVIVGGYIFRNTEPRSFLALNNCEKTCLKPNELAGLLVSVGIQNASSLIPKIIKETDKTIAVEHPFPESKIHYLVFPKKDIKDISKLSNENKEYLDDAYGVMTEIIEEKKLTKYRIITNGPAYQHVTYLHFHLQAKE